MKRAARIAAASAGAALAVGVAGSPPAGAVQTPSPGYWTTGTDCRFAGLNSNAIGQTWSWGTPYDCDRVWVQVHWRDADKNRRTSTKYHTVNPDGDGAVWINLPSGSEVLYTCHAAKDEGHNWGSVRKLVLNETGSCGAP